MKTEKLYLSFFLGIRGWILIACFVFITACSDPDYTKQFVLEPGKKRLEIDVNRHCTYYVGISFTSKASTEHERSRATYHFFGGKWNRNMPAIVDISLLNESGESSFSVVNFGGAISSGAWSGPPLRLIAGHAVLESGKYSVEINVKNITADFSGFKTEFFVTVDKDGCQVGKRNPS